MKLDKDDIQTAKEMAKVLCQSGNNELVIVGNLLDALLKERETAQPKAEQEPKREPRELREWVGLTDEEIAEWTPEIHDVIRAIEAKLKAKNFAKEKNT